ncbi:CapA family protein [Thalassobacillus sp. CUG 92003]|uniref:CapA family protein n=1 Tax=Thalassobacillus sp. CUG 92003 TaxID=2736641 RepID=UPI0015E7DEEA|nr:CapA family protein [Thalassobacillus sp. CUG 92003]
MINYAKIMYITLFVLLLSGCNPFAADETTQKERSADHISFSQHNPHQKAQPDIFIKNISISAIGDILVHKRVYRDAKTNDGYAFMPMMKQVKPYLNDTTISIANQETMIAGQAHGLSGYPTFNTPKSMGNTLKSLGIDVVSLANNHTLDQGPAGVKSAISHWEKLDMKYTGAYKSQRDRERLRVFQSDAGIDTAFLSYTYGTNGIPVPTGQSYLVNTIDYAQMRRDINKAKQQADAVVLSLHAGDEYEPLPNQLQKNVVQFAADLGVDAVIGHHPHVLQPIEWVEGKQGNRMLAAYSLGNFFSGQTALKKRIGGILKFDLEKRKDAQDTIQVKRPKFLLTYVTSAGPHNFEVLPMHDLDEADLEDHQNVYLESKQHVSQFMPELKFVGSPKGGEG